MIRVGIIGAAGYAGAELIRYLSLNPRAQITMLVSDSSDGKPISEAYPSFLGLELPLCEKYSIESVREKCAEAEQLELVLGNCREEDLDGVEICVISPGIDLEQPVVKQVLDRGIPLIGELELAYRYDKGTVIAITKDYFARHK